MKRYGNGIGRVLMLMALPMLFMVTAAPGGGFGGGFGGAHVGGFGGGGFTGGVSGAHVTGSGASGSSIPSANIIGLIVLFSVIIVVVSTALEARKNYPVSTTADKPIQFITIGLTIPTSPHFSASDLAALIRTADFSEALSRQQILQRLNELLANTQENNGFILTSPPAAMKISEAGRTAKTLAQDQMQVTEITPDTINLAENGRLLEKVNGISHYSYPFARSPLCLIGLVAAVSNASLLQEAGDTEMTVRQAIATLAALPSPSLLEALYLYYSPSPGEALTEAQVTGMLADMKSVGTAAPLPDGNAMGETTIEPNT